MSETLEENPKRPGRIHVAMALVLVSLLTLAAINVWKNSIDPLTADEKAWLRAHPVIRFAPDPDFPPTEFFDSNENYAGITADFLNLIEKKLGIRFQVVRLRNWDEVIGAARDRRIDVFAATETPLRLKFASFTTPFLELPAAIIAREKVKEPITLEDLKGMKVSAVSGYAVQEFITSRHPDVRLDVVPDVQTGLRKVSFGTSDAFVENLATASHYIEKEGISNLRIVGESGFVYRVSFASRSDWPELNRILEKGLMLIGKTEKKAIYRKWIPIEPQTLLASKGFQTALLITFYVIVLIIAGIIAWNRTLQKQVRARTVELEKELARRVRTEEDLRFTQYAIDRALDQALWMTGDGLIFYVNDAACRALGYIREELVGMSIRAIYPIQQADIFAEHWRELREKGSIQMETLHRAKDGRTYPVEIRANHVVFDGKEYICSFATDITERKRAEESLLRLNEDLENRVAARTSDLAMLNANLVQEVAMRREAEEKLRHKKDQLETLNSTLEQRIREEVAKNREKDILLFRQNRQAAMGEIIEHIAHQWKQPLNALSLTAQTLEEAWRNDAFTEEQLAESVSRILSLVDHMAQTVNVFKDFYNPEKEKATFLVKESIEKALSFIKPALRFESVQVDLRVDPELSVVGYQKEYAQVLLNILSNAREVFRERGTASPRVTIESAAVGGKAVVTITDNAGGIPGEHLDRIFDMYFTTRESRGGTGLGLYLSRNIIEKSMGGRLTVANAEEGASFRIELDMAAC